MDIREVNVKPLSKEDQIDFLTSLLNEKIALYLKSLASYRSMTTLHMSGEFSKDIVHAQTQTKKALGLLEIEIRHIREMIQEIKEGKLII